MQHNVWKIILEVHAWFLKYINHDHELKSKNIRKKKELKSKKTSEIPVKKEDK
jgi:hypothetical protein